MPDYNKNDPSTIQSMFNSIAKRYDLTNAVLSMQLHKRWNRILVNSLLSRTQGNVWLDLCSGTGDIAFQYLKTASHPCEVYFVDFCSGMLACAQSKVSTRCSSYHHLHFIEADVQELPLQNNLSHYASMAYGIRNVKNPFICLKEVFRVLKPGGYFGVLELTQPENRFLKLGHHLYLRTALPLLGKWLTANEEAYQYLQNSIHTFIAPSELEKLFLKAGFIHTEKHSLSGGIATILIGQKPHVV
jgi:demethylmenaquinone methyltransferase / 2-methoxy-6-polyprenyl-1,4-benzoquinol methylase